MLETMNVRARWLVYAALLMTIGGVYFAVAAHVDEEVDPYFKIGRNGEVNFDRDVWIRDVVLKKGQYTVEHRLEDSQHIFVFTLKRDQKDVESTSEPIIVASRSVFPGELVLQSMIHAKEEKDHTVRVTMIEMAGEMRDHAF